MERGPVDAFPELSGSNSGCASWRGVHIGGHPFFGLRKGVPSGLASAVNSAIFRTQSRRYFGPVKTQSTKETRPLMLSPNIYRLNTLNIRRLLNSSSPTVTAAISHSVPFII